jgi:hypothetical protein
LNLISQNINSRMTDKVAMEIARSYSVLSSKKKLNDVLSSAIRDVDLSGYSKFELHKLCNSIILSKYSSEPLIKSLLVDYFLDERVIAAFEIRTNKSRLDFLRLNGHSISYEIKSEVDNLVKLEKQVLHYSELFEFNNVVVGKKHLSKVRKIIPSAYGIFIEENGKLFEKRKAKKNNNISPERQLNIFTKKEINQFFKTDIESVLDLFSPKEINSIFKEILKSRYSKKWDFLCQNKQDILPIDYQYFYHHNISPNLIYGN